MPISSSTKIDGATSRYLKLRSRSPRAGGRMRSHWRSVPVAAAKTGAPRAGAPDRFAVRLAAAPLQAVPSEPRRSRCLLRIGAGLGGPGVVDGLLLVHADLLGDLVPLRWRRRRGSSCGSSPAHRRLMPWRSASSYLSVWISDRSSRPVCDACLQRRQIVLGVRPQRQVFRVGVVRIAERIAQRVGQLHALVADLLAVQPLDEQVGRLPSACWWRRPTARSPPPAPDGRPAAAHSRPCRRSATSAPSRAPSRSAR